MLALVLTWICSGEAFAQDELRSWIPTRVGDTWIYQNESRDGATGGVANPKVDRWRTEETVVKLITVPEGTVVVRRMSILDGKPSVAQPEEQAWLIHGDCLYDLAPADWDPRHPNQLSAAFSAKPPWAGGEHVRVFCFPLEPGKTWGKESGHEWRVAEVNDQDPSSPDKEKTFHVTSYIGSGLTEDVWFERGVGIVRETDIHAGTYEEERTQLLYFEPAPNVPIGRAPAPVGELGLQYNYNSLSTSSSGESIQSGGSIYGEYFFKKAAEGWIRRGLFGLVAEFSGSGSGSGSLYTYLFSPRFSSESRRGHVVYYFGPSAGGAHVQVNGTTLAGSPSSAARNSFAYGFDTGMDILAGRYWVVSLYRVDLVSLQVPDTVSGGSHWQSDFRLSAGIGFRFGQH